MAHNQITVFIENKTGKPLQEIMYTHRYDNDITNSGSLAILDVNAKKEIGIADFWTGFLRTGYDYWWVRFKKNNRYYTCKTNFYCFLTNKDADHLGKGVTLKIYDDKMEVLPPESGPCTVSLIEEYAAVDAMTRAHEESGIDPNPAEDLSKKCCEPD